MSDSLATRFYWSKWLTFSFATLLQLSSGLGYTFSIYSNDLKRHFKCVLPHICSYCVVCIHGRKSHLNQSLYATIRACSWNQQQTAAIGTACNVCGYFPLFAGLFYDSMKAYDWWGIDCYFRKHEGAPYLLYLCLCKAHPMMRRLGPMLTVLIGVVLQFGGYYGMWAAAVGHINPPYWVMILLAVAACNGQAWYETAGLVTSVRNFETERWVLRNLIPCGGMPYVMQIYMPDLCIMFPE